MIIKNIEELILGKDAQISVLLKDLKKNKVIYKFNESRQIPSASIIKIIIMLEALNQVDKGIFRLDEIVDINDDDKVDYSIISELEINRFTFKDVITLMIIVSDNTATNVLIDLLGMESINKFSSDLELQNTVLHRKMMDFEAARLGRQNYTSPADMVKVLGHVYKKEILNKNLCNLAIDILKKQKDKAMLSKYLPEKAIIAHKTGELENLNHDIGIFYLEDTEYVLGVFVNEAQNNLEAKEIIANISKMVYEYFQNLR